MINKNIIALCAGFLLGNEKLRKELAKTIKININKLIEINKTMRQEGAENDNKPDQLHAPAKEILQDE